MMRGTTSLYMGIGMVLSLFATLDSLDSLKRVSFIIPWLLGVLLFCVCTYVFFQEVFRYTHYPIRFNRKNRKVYKWQDDGSVLAADWDSLYFTVINADSKTKDQFVAGFVMADDGETIKDMIILSLTTAGAISLERQHGHFEFYRRYMEEGPSNDLYDHFEHWIPPIHQQKETFLWGLRAINSNFSLLPIVAILFSPFTLVASVARWLVMRSCKIPQWPDWVEKECEVATNDPWERGWEDRKLD
jgi:hypothetical protein